jgi:NTE family protein
VLTGDGVVLRHGPLADAVYVSSAMFPLLPPLCVEERWLVDGAFSSSLPVLEAVNEGMDVIIAVNVRQSLKDGKPASFFEHVTSFMGRTCNINEIRELSLAIDLHHHEIILITISFDRVIQAWDAEALPHILEVGQQTVAKHAREILGAIASFSRTASISNL